MPAVHLATAVTDPVTPRLGPATVLTRDGALDPDHVLRRLTFGPRARDRAEIAALGTTAWIERQLAPGALADPVSDAVLARLPRLDASITATRAALGGNTGSWDRMLDLGAATVARITWSERQLFEVVVDVWSNRFNVTSPSSDVWDSRAHYDTVIRAHAMGTFRELLRATTTHPAMLAYLGNDLSRKEAPNENLGRELLELHTVGVTAGYTEDDVKASARILTGLSRDFWGTGEAVYQASWHAVGPVAVLDFTHPNASAAGGPDVVAAYLDHLAAHPATARSVARALAVRFVSDTPSDALVGDLAAVYLAGGTAIVPVLRALFAHPEFAASAGAKVRRPLEDAVGVLRAFGVGPDPTGTQGSHELYYLLDSIGHAPLGWHPPNGYPDVAVAWASPAAALNAWNVRSGLLAGWWPNTLQTPALMSLLPGPLPTTWGQLVDRLSVSLLGTTLPAAERAAILSFGPATEATALYPNPDWWNLTALATLVMSSTVHTTR